MKIYRVKFKEYLDDLGRRKPSPAGGSALCLAFCLGVSLLEKAINYSLERKRNLKKQRDYLTALRRKIYSYIDLDGKIFAQILKAKEKKKKELIKKSEKIIIDLAKASLSAISLAKRLEFGIKKSIISDFYIGKDFLKITLKGCIYNLEANKRIFKKDTKFISIFKRILKQWEKF